MKPKFPLQIPPGFEPVDFKSETSAFICYIILCDKTGKWYVGSGQSGRIWHHFSKSTHHNDKLYKDFIKFGEKSFKFWIRDCENEAEYKAQEQVLLDLLPKVPGYPVCNQKYCYNKSINAGGGNNYDPEDPKNIARRLAQSKPFALRDANTHELIHSFGSTTDKTIPLHFETLKTSGSVSNYLKDGPNRGELLCVWNFGVLVYLCYSGESINELELRTGRCFTADRDAKLEFISEVTVRNTKTWEVWHLSDYDTYYGAAQIIGLPKTQWGNFGDLIQGKPGSKSCDGWIVIWVPVKHSKLHKL